MESSTSHAAPQNEKKGEQQLIPSNGHFAQNHTEGMGVGNSANPASGTSTSDCGAYLSEIQIPVEKNLGSVEGASSHCSDADPGHISECLIPERESIINSESQIGTHSKETESRHTRLYKENKDPEESSPRDPESSAESHSKRIAQSICTLENRLTETSVGSSSQDFAGADADKAGIPDFPAEKSVEDDASEKEMETTPNRESSRRTNVDENIGELGPNTTEKVVSHVKDGKASLDSDEPMANGPLNIKITAKPALINSLAFLPGSQSEEDSEDESTLKIDEDKVLEESETSINATGDRIDKSPAEPSSNVGTDEGGDSCTPDSEPCAPNVLNKCETSMNFTGDGIDKRRAECTSNVGSSKNGDPYAPDVFNKGETSMNVTGEGKDKERAGKDKERAESSSIVSSDKNDDCIAPDGASFALDVLDKDETSMNATGEGKGKERAESSSIVSSDKNDDCIAPDDASFALNVLDKGETSMNATGEGKDKERAESSSIVGSDKRNGICASEGDSSSPNNESDTSRNQAEGTPFGSDGKHLLSSDSLRLRDLKIKLEKFKEINRTWQRRKPELNSENSGRSTPTLARTNIFDALNASLPSTTGESADANLPEIGDSDENIISDSGKDTYFTSNNNPEQTKVTDNVETAPNISSNESELTQSAKAHAKVHASSDPMVAGDARVLCDKNITRDNGSATSIVRTELEPLNDRFGNGPVQQSNQQVNESASILDTAISVQLTNDTANMCSSATKLNQAESSGSDKEVVTASVLPNPSEDLNYTAYNTVASQGYEKQPSSSVTATSQRAEEPLEDEAQNLRIAEVFTLHGDTEKSTTSTTDSAFQTAKKPTVRSKPNESLLNILNKSADDPSTPIKRTPQKPAEVNWPDLGVKRCPRCSFTTSDDALLQVHTCKRTVGGIAVSSTEKPSPAVISKLSGLANVIPETQPQKTTKDDDLSSASSGPRKKIFMPPPSPKVQRGMNSRIVRLDKNGYLCTICNYRANYAFFIGHLVEHMVEYPYTCPYCTSPGTLYFQRCSDVTAHVNTHKSASHKFSMFGYSAAKEFLDRLAKSGAEILSNIWIDPTMKLSELVPDTSTLLPIAVRPYMSPTSTMTQTGINLSTATPLVQPVFTSVAMTKGMQTAPVSSVRFSPNVVSPPATASSSLSTAPGLGPVNVVRQDGVQVQRPGVPTLVQSGPISGNSLLLLVPSQTVGQGSAVQQTASSTNVTATVSMPNATILPRNQPISSTTQMQPSVSTNLQQTEKPSKSAKLTSILEPMPAVQKNSHRPPSILKRANNSKGEPVTVGRIRDKMFCFGCNYKTVSKSEFKNHIWKHLHGNNTHCAHQRSPGAPPSTAYCPFVEKIFVAVPVLNSGSTSTNGSQLPSQSSPSESQRDPTSETEGVSVKPEKKEDHSVNEEDDSYCEIISVGKPKPLCIDLTEDEISPYTEATTENEKRKEDESNSSYSLGTENSTAVDNTVLLSENARTNVNNEVRQGVEEQDTANEEKSSTPQPVRSSQNIAVRDSMFYVCGFSNCKFSCITSEQFKHHLLTHHQGANQYPCAHCGHKSPGEEELFRHMLSHSSAKAFLLYKCGFTNCRFGTNLISEFQQHNNIFHKDAESFTCASCKGNFSSLTSLCNHFAESLLKFVQCPYCSVKTKDRRTILQHIGQTHPDKPRQITVTSQLVCNSINQEKKSGKKHLSPDQAANGSHRNIETSVDKPITSASVDISGKATPDTVNTNQASNRLSEASNLQCLLCSKVLKSVAELIKHYGGSHKGPHELTIHNCKFCKFCTNDIVHMEKHMGDFHPNESMLFKSTKRCIPQKEFKCQVCSHVTCCPEELSEHFNRHEVVNVQLEISSFDPATIGKISKFTCQKCQMNFERYAKLETHTYKNHPDVNRIQVYKCEICAFFSTALRATVQHRNRAHSGKEKIHRFYRFMDRTPELKTTTPVLKTTTTEPSEHDFSVHWFHCENCSFSSSTREDLSEHLKSHNVADDSLTSTQETLQLDQQSESNRIVPAEGVLDSNVKCPHCEYSTNVKVNLVRHMAQHKSTDVSSISDNFKELPWKTPSIESMLKNVTSSPNESKKPDAKRKLQQNYQEPNGSQNSPKRGEYDIHPASSPTKSGQEFYKCRLCSFRASNIQNLYGHLSSHKSATYQKCSYCPYKCTNKSVMIKHLKKRHKNMPRKYEKAVNVSADNNSPDGKQPIGKKRKALDDKDIPEKKVKRKSTDTSAYECVLCGFKTNTIDGLEEHFKRSHDVKAFVCSRCKYHTLRLLEMEDHLETVHNQKQMLYKMSDVNSNTKDRTNSKPITPTKSKSSSSPTISDGVLSKHHMKCGLCSSITASKSALIEHSVLRHGVDVEPVMSPVQVHKCVDCGRRFRHRQEAKEHNVECIKRVLKESERTAAAEHSKQSAPVETGSNDKASSPVLTRESPKDKTAPLKEKSILSKTKTSSPKENNHTGLAEPNEDLQSLENSNTKDTETLHMLDTSGSKEKYKYFCHLCKHSGVSRRRMKEHYFEHYKYYPYKCVYCPKVASRSDRLHKHILRVHPGKVLDSKLRRNEQTELKIDRLLKEKRQLLSDVQDNAKKSSKNSCTASLAESSPDSKKEQTSKVEKSSPQSNDSSKGNTRLFPKRDYDPSNPFHCEHCNFTTRNKNSLLKHIVLHGPARIKCHLCSHKGHFPYAVKRHYERLHPGEEMAFIRIQPEDDPLHTSVPTKASHPGESPASCLERPSASTSGIKRKAEESFSELDNFKIIADEDLESKVLAHLPLQELYKKYQDETGTTAYKCLLCDFSSHTSGYIAAHMYKHMPKCFQCCYCDFRAYPSSSVTTHMRRSHDGEPCKFKFFEDLALRIYNKMLATLGKLPFEMPKTKKRKVSLDIKEETSSSDESGSETSSKCKTPSDSKKSESSMKSAGNASDTGPINFCCHLCKFKIRDRGLFGEHLSLHEAFMRPGNLNESAKCGFCSFSSANVKEFNDHVSTHVSERPFKCLRCGYSCFTKTHIRSHIKNKHPGEKISYSETSPGQKDLVRENTPVDTACVNFEPSVEIRDILLLKNSMFDRLVSSFGITAANLGDLSDDKFNAVIRASGFTDEDIYSDIDTSAPHEEDSCM